MIIESERLQLYKDLWNKLLIIREANDNKYSIEEGCLTDVMTELWMVMTDKELEEADKLPLK
jgi:hypothetical protein